MSRLLRTSVHHGLVLLNKKSGLTSFDSLKIVKRAFATGKVGHTGTLDKFASGLLLILVGRGVKLAPLFSGCDKEYTATVRFGEETETLDPEGAVVAQSPLPAREAVEAVLDSFRGEILQAPPAYSAIHIGGKRAHELAREGKVPEMKKRPVTIHALEIVSWSPPEMVMRVRCSAGTYIRSLARDIALAAGSRAHLTALVRTSVGVFRVEDSVDGGDDGVEGEPQHVATALRPLDSKLFKAMGLPCIYMEEKAAQGFLHGKPLAQLLPPDLNTTSFANAQDDTSSPLVAGVFKKPPAGMDAEASALLGVVDYRNGAWSYAHVFSE